MNAILNFLTVYVGATALITSKRRIARTLSSIQPVAITQDQQLDFCALGVSSFVVEMLMLSSPVVGWMPTVLSS